MIRVVLPQHLRTLADVEGEVELAVAPPICVQSILDALEARFPMLQGTIREHDGGARRPKLRFFAAQKDITHDSFHVDLPESIVCGAEPLMIVGAISGG